MKAKKVASDYFLILLASFVILAAGIIIFPNSTLIPRPAFTTLKFLSLIGNPDSGATNFYADNPDQNLVLSADNLRDWQNLWAKINQGADPLPPLPETDFSQNSLIVAMTGRKASGGYSINIDKIYYLKDGSLFVSVQEKTPPADALVTDVITRPYHIVSIPKVATDTIRFRFTGL